MPLGNRGNVTPRRDTVTLYSRLNLGATGAITTQTTKKYSGLVAARTGVGTYTLTLDKTAMRYAELLEIDCRIIGANSTYAAAAGIDMFITSDLTTTTGVITIQFRRTDTGANAEVENNAKLLFELTLSLSASAVA